MKCYLSTAEGLCSSGGGGLPQSLRTLIRSESHFIKDSCKKASGSTVCSLAVCPVHSGEPGLIPGLECCHHLHLQVNAPRWAEIRLWGGTDCTVLHFHLELVSKWTRSTAGVLCDLASEDRFLEAASLEARHTNHQPTPGWGGAGGVEGWGMGKKGDGKGVTSSKTLCLPRMV